MVYTYLVLNAEQVGKLERHGFADVSDSCGEI